MLLCVLVIFELVDNLHLTLHFLLLQLEYELLFLFVNDFVPVQELQLLVLNLHIHQTQVDQSLIFSVRYFRGVSYLHLLARHQQLTCQRGV